MLRLDPDPLWRCAIRRSQRIAVVLAVALLGAVPAAEAAPFVAKLKTPSAQPRADRQWTITVTARSRSGKALRATAFYQFLFQGRVVSTQYPSPGKPPGTAHKPYAFLGRYRDGLLFPPRAVGIPLTLRVVVRVRGMGSSKLDKRIRVRS
jgi:hypothetical protein